nr:hypothetical protein [Candidatus Sigynarchaeota archaeon]
MIDGIREKLMVLSRGGVRACSESIKKLHRREGGVDELIETARANLKDMLGIIEQGKQGATLASYLDTRYQELVEAITLRTILQGKDMQPPSRLDPPVPPVPFVQGICDAIGELRRACLDSVRMEQFEEAEHFFNLMERLHEHVNSLDYPNAMIPEVRHKSDVNRKLINATRSDLTMVFQMNKLTKNLSRLTKN